MKRMRARSKLLVASAFIVGLILLLIWSLRSKPAGKDWLSVSQPVFGSRTNAKGIFPTVSVVISNAGPRRMEYWVYWLECRARANFTLLATNDLLPGFVPLKSRAAANLTWDLAQSPVPGQVPLFCCQIEWIESEPTLWRLGRKLEPHLTQTVDIFDPQWVPPWDSESKPPRARGPTFASNVEVAEYFRLVYGFTRSGWLEERARYEAQAQQATQSYRYGRSSALSAEDTIKLKAKSAFVSFCQKTTNVLEQVAGSPALQRP